MDDKLRQVTEIELHFHRWTLHEIGLPPVVVRYVEKLMRKRLLMALPMTAEELQAHRLTSTGPWLRTELLTLEHFTDDDWAELSGLNDTLLALAKVHQSTS